MKGKRLLVNTVFMTVTSLLLRSLGLTFQVFLSRKMGAAGIGLFQLTMSVSSLASTFAISGIRFATTRLVSEEMGRGRMGNMSRVLRRCLAYAVVFGSAAAGILWFSSNYVAARFVGDARTALSLRLLSVSLPFLSAGAVLGGYFTGVCRVGRAVAASISEQLCRMAVSYLLLSAITTANMELMCAAVAAGGAAGEVFSFFVILLLYLTDKKRVRGEGAATPGLTGRMLGIAMPLALTAYARTALSTVQNLLIPSGLRRSGASAEAALAGYGMIQGMVFPIITFPMVLFASVSELIVPELTEEQMQGHDTRIAAAANMLLKLCLVFSLGVMAALLCFAGELGSALYGSAQVGHYIRLLALLMPVMYLDNITDGMLRGLGEHMYSMRVNIVDSFLSTALIWLLLPRFAVYGYIFILYASEVFNFSLSMRKLARITRIELNLPGLLLALCSAAGAVTVTRLAVNISGGANGTVGLVTGIFIFCVVYIILTLATRTLDRGELQVMLRAIR